MVRFLTKDEVEATLDMSAAIDAVEDAFRLQKDAIVPNRVQIKQDDPEGDVFVMPGVVGASDTLGLKTVTIYPGNDERDVPRSLGTVLLHDNETGVLESVMDGTHITNYRTGAIGAVAARHLAPDGASVAAIFGASTQGRHQALALDTELDLDTIRIYSRSETKHEAVDALSDRVDADLVAADSPVAACETADVVVAATSSPEPVFPAEAVREGALVVGIGSNDSSMRELPGGVMERTERVYVDDYDLCLTVGDIADAIEEGRLTDDDVVRFGELLAEDPPYRAPDETTVVKSVGSIVLDVHVGERVLERAAEAGAGRTIDLQGVE